MARIISFTGPTCAGKSTLARALIAAYPGRVSFGESETTRSPRNEEEASSGEYRYVSKAEFERMIAKNELLWHVEHGGNYYGTRKQTILRGLASEEHITLLILVPSVLGTLFDFIAKERKEHRDILDSWIACYVNPPSEEELLRRLRERGDTDEQIQKRMVSERNWFNETRTCGKSLQLLQGCRSIRDNLMRIEHFVHLHQVA